MKYSVQSLDPRYSFDITGISYIGAPADNTVLFLTGRVKSLLKNLEGRRHCLVFVEDGIAVPEALQAENCFVFTPNPKASYGRLALELAAQEEAEHPAREYTLMPGGWYKGENVTVGKDARIEPGCLIGHGVVIGDRARLGAGTVIRNAVIGDDFRTFEHVSIGVDSYFMAEDGNGFFRIPSFGRVLIGNRVEIGANTVIERGFNTDTRLDDQVRIDCNVSLGHDDWLKEHAEVLSGTSLGGLVTVGRNVYVGMNAVVKQRLSIGDDATVGMGSAVISNVKAGTSVFGAPARKVVD